MNQAIPGEVRCQQCKEKNQAKWKANREKINARRRELYFQETLEREHCIDFKSHSARMGSIVSIDSKVGKNMANFMGETKELSSYSPLIKRLRDTAKGEFRCQHKISKSYCGIAFESNQSVEAMLWFNRQMREYPEEYKHYEMVLVPNKHEELLLKAAEALSQCSRIMEPVSDE